MLLCFVIGFAALAAARNIQFDCRVPAGTPLQAFDKPNGLFGPSYVFGKNLSFSKLLQLPAVGPSLFDTENKTVPVEVTIR